MVKLIVLGGALKDVRSQSEARLQLPAASMPYV